MNASIRAQHKHEPAMKAVRVNGKITEIKQPQDQSNTKIWWPLRIQTFSLFFSGRNIRQICQILPISFLLIILITNRKNSIVVSEGFTYFSSLRGSVFSMIILWQSHFSSEVVFFLESLLTSLTAPIQQFLMWPRSARCTENVAVCPLQIITKYQFQYEWFSRIVSICVTQIIFHVIFFSTDVWGSIFHSMKHIIFVYLHVKNY